MNLYAPKYYQQFACIADRCKHSCCVGWEIDIDPETYAFYQNAEGAFGDRLRNGITLEEDTPHFCLTKEERCPFLNQDNLCDIILQLGEDALCQICTDHPRFRNFFDSREELGLGLCCEAAASLIVTQKEPFCLTALHNDKTPETPEETAFFAERDKIFSLLKNRDESVEERVKRLIYTYGLSLPERNYAQWASVFWELERLEPSWTDRLFELKKVGQIPESLFADSSWELAWEQLLLYFVYRHTAEACYDDSLKVRLSFSVLSIWMLKGLCAGCAMAHGTVSLEDLTEIARQYSAEVEYSEGNMDALFALLDNKKTP